MELQKVLWIGVKRPVQKIKKINILKIGSAVLLITTAVFLTNPVQAQGEKDSTVSVYSAGADTYSKMLDYSRPGKYHQLYAS